MDLKFVCVWLIFSLKTVLSLDKDLSCAVCRALVDEVNYSISKVDPKKKIQVGSFRVDSKGNQGTYEKPYARSEIHLMEIFETICENLGKYAESTNIVGKKSIGRTESRDGKALSLSNIKLSAEIGKQLRHRCESLIEDNEDDIIALFRKDDIPDIENVLCVDTTNQCSEEDMKIPMPTTEYDDVEEAKRARDEETKSESTDDELVESFLKDNSDGGSIAADTVMEQTVHTDSNTGNSPTAGDKQEL